MTSHEPRATSHGKRTSALLAGVLLLLDQVMKYFFSDSVRGYCNPDGPWGMPADTGVLIAVMIVVLAGVLYLFWKTGMFLGRFSLAFVLAGGLSNLFDRIALGCVRDYAVFSWFPAFNPADVFLTIGAGAFFATFFLQEKSSRK